jgi:multidrug efflux pump subunit AcrA (membrane-fusion protein)
MNSREHTNASGRLTASGNSERSGAQHIIHRPSSIVFLAIVIAAVALPGCGKKPDNTAEAAGKKPGAIAGGAATAVTAAPAVVNDITKTVDVTGSLVALQDVIVGAKIAGKVQAVYFHEGDTVSAGQVVAMMDLADFRNNVLQQQANLQSANP